VNSRRIAFLDVDGTILDHRGTVAPSTVDAIRSARAAGHLVFLSTGRSAGDVPPAVRMIGFDGVVSNGGAYATVGDKTDDPSCGSQQATNCRRPTARKPIPL